MKTHSRWLGLVVFALSLIVCQQARAASITGKVVEVNEGDEITIFNLNRNVRIRLMAIDAPEPSQAFGAVAKQHLLIWCTTKWCRSSIGELVSTIS